MKSRTDIKKGLLALCSMLLLSASGRCQLVQANPLEYEAIAEGNILLNGAVSNETKKMNETAALQGAMGAEFSMIKSWEKKYNSYLKTARGYAETLKAGTTLYADGVQTFMRLMEVKRAIAANPQGIGATLSMNDLYVETAIEFLKTYRSLKHSVSKGGGENMLNSAERTEMLWSLTEQIESMNRKLHALAISIAYYNLTDVWKKATAGMTCKSHADIAGDALDRWKRASQVSQIINP